MTAEVIQIRDYQSKRDVERVQELLQEPVLFNAELSVWPDFSSAARYHAPEDGRLRMSGRERLRAKLDSMREAGLINFKFTPGPKWPDLSPDEKCGALADALEADRTLLEGPPRSRKPPVNIRELVDSL